MTRKPPLYWMPIPGASTRAAIGGTYQTAQLHVRITPDLYRSLKVCAAENGITLQDLVETAMRKALRMPAHRLKKGGKEA